MLDQTEIARYRGAKIIGADGDKIGKVDEIYLDDRTGRPEWALVNTGLFGASSTFVPLAQADAAGGDLRVPYDKAKVKDAPRLDADQHLDESQERELYRYYGLDFDTDYDTAGTAGYAGTETTRGTVGRDTSGPTTDNAMTRSEEELRVGTTQREAGRARLRKWVESETVTKTVPVTREEVHIEREPITDANVGAATSGRELSEEEHEVTLTEEQAVVDKQVVPKERIRLDKDTVTDQQQVTEEVRKEQVGMDEGDVTDRRI